VAAMGGLAAAATTAFPQENCFVVATPTGGPSFAALAAAAFIAGNFQVVARTAAQGFSPTFSTPRFLRSHSATSS
jgi:hypothetical protein